MATAGGGASIRAPGKTAVAAPVATPELVGTVSWHFLPEPLRSTVAGNMAFFGTGMGFRCAAHFVLYHKLRVSINFACLSDFL